MAAKPTKGQVREFKKVEFRRALNVMGTTPHKIAKDIGISRRQAYRYTSGESEIPEAMMILVRMLVKRQRQNGKA